MKISELKSIIAKFPEKRLLCVGDVMLDRFIEGDVARISPEAPVPVLRIKRENITLGGGGNLLYWVRVLNGAFFALLFGVAYIFCRDFLPDRRTIRISVLLLLAVFPQDLCC